MKKPVTSLIGDSFGAIPYIAKTYDRLLEEIGISDKELDDIFDSVEMRIWNAFDEIENRKDGLRLSDIILSAIAGEICEILEKKFPGNTFTYGEPGKPGSRKYEPYINGHVYGGLRLKDILKPVETES